MSLRGCGCLYSNLLPIQWCWNSLRILRTKRWVWRTLSPFNVQSVVQRWPTGYVMPVPSLLTATQWSMEELWRSQPSRRAKVGSIGVWQATLPKCPTLESYPISVRTCTGTYVTEQECIIGGSSWASLDPRPTPVLRVGLGTWLLLSSIFLTQAIANHVVLHHVQTGTWIPANLLQDKVFATHAVSGNG